MTFEVLRASSDADAARWRSLIGALPADLRDVHFLPEYGRIYEEAQGLEALLAAYRSPDGLVIQPLVRRPLAALPFLKPHDDGTGFFDVTNPYGFGGPLGVVSGDGATLVQGFAHAFARWCDDGAIASEFTCLHPFLEASQRSLIGDAVVAHHEKDVVFIDLDQDEAALLAGLRKGHRSSITRAKKSGVEVHPADPAGPDLELFCEMYAETMRRRSAAARWLLSPEFFKTTVRHLGTARVSLLMATIEGKPESACLLMHDFGTAYYHFAATFATRPELGVNNLMVFEAARLMRAAGMRRLHLGGGVTSAPDDSLFLFKAGFSSGRAPLYTYFAVRAETVYDELCRRKRAYERQTDGAESASDFLPLYRR